ENNPTATREEGNGPLAKGDPGLYESGAGEGKDRGPPRRYLVVRRAALGNADRPPAVRGRNRHRDSGAGADQGARPQPGALSTAAAVANVPAERPETTAAFGGQLGDAAGRAGADGTPPAGVAGVGPRRATSSSRVMGMAAPRTAKLDCALQPSRG